MYFIIEDGLRKGPLTLDQIARLPIGPATLIEREGAGVALPADHTPELWPVLAARRAAGRSAGPVAGGPQHIPFPDDPKVRAIRERFAAPAPVCPAVIAANVLVWAAMVATGANWLTPDGGAMLRWGADFWPATTSGQWWRLLTAAFLHFGVVHLAANMYALWSMGRFAERVFGSGAFAALYLLCALISSLVSIWWDPHAVTAGASGAVFGVFGAVLSYLLIRKASFPRHALRVLLQGTVVVIGFNVFFGLTQKGISNSAHLGGLAAGVVLGAIFATPLELDRHRRQRLPRLLIGLTVGAAALAGGVVAVPKAAAGSFDLRAELAFERLTETLPKEENAIIDRYNRLLRDARARDLDDAQFARRLDADVLPLWDELVEHVRSAEVPAGSPWRPRWERLLAYAQLRRDAYRALAEGLRAGDERTLERHEGLMRRADREIDAAR